jgi:hypothetical protein
MREVLVRIGLVAYGGNYETVRRRIAELGLDTSHLRSSSRVGLAARSDDEIAHAVARSRSYAQVMARLGIRPGGTQARLTARVRVLRLDTSHFVGQAWSAGMNASVGRRTPIEELLVVGRLVWTSGLRRRLIADGLKEARCERCRRARWNGQPIALELDHVNGRRDDNRLANLRILCPNCHAQTVNYRGRNIGAAAYS